MKYNYNSTWNQLYLPPVGDTFPVGAVVDYSGTTAPHNWLICDGSAVSRTTYSALFSVIGTTYGTGDGSTTFNLPNFTGKVGVGYASGDTDFGTLGKTGGEKTHTLTIPEMPSHTHTSIDRMLLWDAGKTGLFGTVGTSGTLNAQSSGWAGSVVNNTGENQAHNNLQPYIVQNKIIKAYNVSASPVIVSEIDSALSTTSTNPVQNKVITEAIAKNYIIGVLSSNVTLTNSSSTKLPLVLSLKSGDKFSISNGGILISNGVQKVKISAQGYVSTIGSTGTKKTMVYNGSSNLNIDALIYANNSYSSMAISSVIVNVNPGDILYLYCTGTSNDVWEGNGSNMYNRLCVEEI